MSRPLDQDTDLPAQPPVNVPGDAHTSGRGYWRNIVSVLSGTMLAQAVPILIMPVLTRLVMPAEMGLFSIWQGLVGIAAILVNLRLDVAVTVADSDNERRAGVALASRLAIGLSLVVMAVFCVLQQPVSEMAQGWSLTATVALGLGAWALASNTLWRACAVTLSRFRMLSAMRIVTAVSVAGAQLAGALTIGGAMGLAWGYVAGTAAGALLGKARLHHGITANTDAPDRAARRAFLRRHAETPLYAMPADLINNISQQLPILLIGARFGPELAGLYALMIRAVDAPLSVFSGSVQDVYKRRAVSEYQQKGECRDAFFDTLKVLALVALLPAGLLAIAAPPLFAVVFGEAYRGSGEMARLLVPMIYLRFFASPLGYTLYIGRQANRQLYWQVALLLVTVATLMLPSSHHTAIAAYGIGYAALYVVYLWLAYQSARGRPRPATGSEASR